MQHHLASSNTSGLERYLFGQAALMRDADLRTILGFGAAALGILAVCWKEMKLLAFDPDYAAVLGFPVRRLDLLLTTLIVVAVVIGLQAVGVVLMTALADRSRRRRPAVDGQVGSDGCVGRDLRRPRRFRRRRAQPCRQ